jgi:2-methylcitrate dehydratase PrpD
MNSKATIQRSALLADEVLAIGETSLASEDRAQVQKLVLDHLACCYLGAHVPWGLRLREWAHAHGSSGRAPLFGDSESVSPPIAAFVNATAAHGLELDDTHDESISHPGAPVIATAIAIAVARDCDADELFAAITAGYEVVARVGAATNAAQLVEHGFHPTSLFTGFGAVAVAACLYGFETVRLQRAWGLMLSMAGGSMQFSQEAVGTTVKRLHGGLAALHGVMAADLAVLDIFGPERALDGRYGLINIFGHDQAPQRLNEPHSQGPEIHRISFKAYPCCRFFHSTLDALHEVTDGFSIDPKTINRYCVGGPEVLSTQHVLRRPQSEMAAQYSLPFALGAATVFGPRSVDGYSEVALANKEILEIADRVDVVIDEKLQGRFPGHFGSWLEIEMNDGSSRRAEVLDSIGTPKNPMTRDALIDKFDSLVAPINPGLQGDGVARAIETLDDAASIQALLLRFRSSA